MSSARSFELEVDGFCYTFDEPFDYSSSSEVSISDYSEDEGKPNNVGQDIKLWKKGTLWVHDNGLILN
jgi:hypothetical protein